MTIKYYSVLLVLTYTQKCTEGIQVKEDKICSLTYRHGAFQSTRLNEPWAIKAEA